MASVDESKEWIGRPAVLFACENGVAVSRVQFQGYSRYAGPHVFQLKVDGVPFGEEEPRFIEDSRVVGKQFWLREGPESFALTRLLLQSALGRKTRISNGYLYFEVDMGTKAFREEVWERLRACGGS